MMIGGHAMIPMPSWANSGTLGQTSSVLLLHKRETPLAMGATGLPATPAVARLPGPSEPAARSAARSARVVEHVCE
jgi:hypothetical protein